MPHSACPLFGGPSLDSSRRLQGVSVTPKRVRRPQAHNACRTTVERPPRRPRSSSATAPLPCRSGAEGQQGRRITPELPPHPSPAPRRPEHTARPEFPRPPYPCDPERVRRVISRDTSFRRRKHPVQTSETRRAGAESLLAIAEGPQTRRPPRTRETPADAGYLRAHAAPAHTRNPRSRRKPRTHADPPQTPKGPHRQAAGALAEELRATSWPSRHRRGRRTRRAGRSDSRAWSRRDRPRSS
jgi:hypothetical protein